MDTPHNGNGRYAVGRGKPPVDTRFKKGQSGNPSGRPKGAKSFSALLKRRLNRPTVVEEQGQQRTITMKEAIVEQLVQRALAGDIRMMEMLREDIRESEARAAKRRKVSNGEVVDAVDRILGLKTDENGPNGNGTGK